MSELDTKLSTGGGFPVEGHYEMKVTKSDETFNVTFLDDVILGELNTQLEKAMEELTEQHIVYEVLAPIRAIRETIGRVTKEKDAVARVNINVYAPRKISQQVGREFSNHKIWLQRPDYVRPGTTYDNPHVLKLPQFQLPPTETATASVIVEQKEPEMEKAESFKKTISDVYSSLKRGHALVGLEGDGRLKTPLLLHQKEALEFMSQRENGPVPDEFLLWKPDEIEGQPCYRHAITGAVSRLHREETGGGILADEMGMGKTLSILALVLRTLEPALEWSSQNKADAMRDHSIGRQSLIRTRATLIIASSDLMINEWMQEMERHFQRHTTGMLKTIKYHGQYRETEVEKLRDADLIITTYHTLASDFATKRNPLAEFEWYRLVLDEAHIIRRQSTGLYRTVHKLKARARWCLTGTPIQNRLEDIGSLFAFIRASPFDSMSNFRKFIAIPFDEGPKRRKLAIERFTRLLDSLCLRRTKDRLHLPAQLDRIRRIEFSSEEELQYDQTKKTMFRAVRNQGSVFDHQSTLGMFQVQLQLRILCNHGTFQHPFSWNRRKMHLLDEQEDMENSLGTEGEVACSGCRQPMPIFGDGSTYKRYNENCKHVLCFECIEESMPRSQEVNTSTADKLPTQCPLCAALWGSMKGTVPSHSHRSAHSAEHDSYFRSEGRSSKMEALMVDVQADLWTTKRYAILSPTSYRSL
jgi:SNF2 family DNA or RNA helicase